MYLVYQGPFFLHVIAHVTSSFALYLLHFPRISLYMHAAHTECTYCTVGSKSVDDAFYVLYISNSDDCRAASRHLRSICNWAVATDALDIFTNRYKWLWRWRPWDWCWHVSPWDDLLTRHLPDAFRHQLPWREVIEEPMTLTIRYYCRCFSANEKKPYLSFLIARLGKSVVAQEYDITWSTAVKKRFWFNGLSVDSLCMGFKARLELDPDIMWSFLHPFLTRNS